MVYLVFFPPPLRHALSLPPPSLPTLPPCLPSSPQTTTEIENFPGFPEGVTGPELMERMRKQAIRWGADCIVEDVEEVDLQQRPFLIKVRCDRFITAATVNICILFPQRFLWIFVDFFMIFSELMIFYYIYILYFIIIYCLL